MKYTGFDPRTAVVRWGLFAVAIGIVFGSTAPTTVRELVAVAEAHGASLPWYTERVTAFLAYLALAGSVIYGLLLSTKLLDAVAHRPVTFTLHQDLASIGLGLAGIHGTLLGLDRTVPFSVVQMAVPFLAPYQPFWVGVGQIAFYLTLAVVASFYLRRRIGQRAWRALHYVTFLAFAGATAHGLGAGTDSGSGWAWWLYVGATDSVLFLLVYRIALSGAKRRGDAARRAPYSSRSTQSPTGG